MPRIYRHDLVVPPESIDENGHVSNIEYVRWMQEAAIAHSTAQGWPRERCLSVGAAWVARSHYIEYLRPAFQDEEIGVLTWVVDFRKIRSRRKYKFVRASDQAVVARAETEWVLVDAKTGQPRVIPPEIEGAFDIVTENEEP